MTKLITFISRKLPREMLVEIFKYLDTDSLRKITTVHEEFCITWLSPQLWKRFNSEEDYFDTRVYEVLVNRTNKVLYFKAKFKYEYEGNMRLQHLLFSMYNLVELNLAGCEIIHNVDFLQVMSKLRSLDLSHCPGMSTVSLIRSVPNLWSLKEFICRGNDVRISAFSIYQCVHPLVGLEVV